jgi:pimeloyl-ACP methyl ester carboxylesterase
MSFKIFIHGLESSNKGTKSVFFKQKFPDMIIPHFTGDLHERMAMLSEILEEKSEIRLVGSSFGGLMATMFAMENEPRVDKLILLAPAINLMASTHYLEQKISIPACIYHGKNDEVIPLQDVASVAKRAFLNLAFHSVDDDHFLHKTFKTIDWDRLLA